MMSVGLQMAKRGVITIPKTLREAYGIQPGDTFSLPDPGGALLLNPGRTLKE